MESLNRNIIKYQPRINNIITRGWNVAPPPPRGISRRCKGHNTNPINEKIRNNASAPYHENQKYIQTN